MTKNLFNKSASRNVRRAKAASESLIKQGTFSIDNKTYLYNESIGFFWLTQELRDDLSDVIRHNRLQEKVGISGEIILTLLVSAIRTGQELRYTDIANPSDHFLGKPKRICRCNKVSIPIDVAISEIDGITHSIISCSPLDSEEI